MRVSILKSTLRDMLRVQYGVEEPEPQVITVLGRAVQLRWRTRRSWPFEQICDNTVLVLLTQLVWPWPHLFVVLRSVPLEHYTEQATAQQLMTQGTEALAALTNDCLHLRALHMVTRDLLTLLPQAVRTRLDTHDIGGPVSRDARRLLQAMGGRPSETYIQGESQRWAQWDAELRRIASSSWAKNRLWPEPWPLRPPSKADAIADICAPLTAKTRRQVGLGKFAFKSRLSTFLIGGLRKEARCWLRDNGFPGPRVIVGAQPPGNRLWYLDDPVGPDQGEGQPRTLGAGLADPATLQGMEPVLEVEERRRWIARIASGVPDVQFRQRRWEFIEQNQETLVRFIAREYGFRARRVRQLLADVAGCFRETQLEE